MTAPTYVVAASPQGGGHIMRFFDADASGLTRLLEQPPSLRWAGFDLSTLGRAEMKEALYLEVSNGERKVIRLYQDGSLLVRVDAGSSFLGWGQSDEDFLRHPRLNPVAAVEVHVAFVTLYTELLLHFSQMPEEIDLRLDLHNAVIGNARLFLTRWYERGIQNVHNPERYHAHSSDPSAQFTVLATRLRQHPFVVAYDLVERFFSLFDMPADKIPFVIDTEVGKAIDEEQIKQL